MPPQSVRIVNVTNNSFSVSWVTDKPTIGAINWGESQSLGSTQVESNNQTNVHLANISNLNPNTTYYFKILSSGQEFDNSGIPWTLQTAITLTTIPSTKLISGNLVAPSGQPVEGAAIFISSPNMSTITTLSSSNGSWVAPLGSARDKALGSYVNLSVNPLLDIFAQAGPQGVSTAQIYADNSGTVPQITLGQTHDFRNTDTQTTTTTNTQNPEANLTLPEDSDTNTSTASSGFDLANKTTPPSPNDPVTIDSITEGEIITTAEPEFFGSGPPATKITLTVESNPISDVLTINDNGAWKWTPPSILDQGNHTLSISWTDISGVLQTITSNFTVSAAQVGDPAFVATPSASPRVSLPSTDSAIPVSGISAPTFALVVLGLGLIVVSTTTSAVLLKRP